MNLEEKVKKKEIIKNKNNSNGLKDSQDIIEEMKYKYRILNKYIKLEDLKNKEKKLRFQDDLASDTTEKPAFLFMRNESKNSIGYKPVTSFCDKYRSREFSSLYKKYVDLNGFKNEKINIKTEAEMIPSTFEDIMSKLEFTDIINNLKTTRNLLKHNVPNFSKNPISIKHHIKTEENNYKKPNLLLKVRDNNNIFEIYTKNLLKTKKNKNHTFSALNNKNKDFFLSKNDSCIGVKKNKKNKRPTTSKYNRKYYIDNNLNNNENNEKENHSFSKNQEGKDLQLNNSKNSNQWRNRYSSNNKFNKNSSCLTTTFKSYSRSSSKYGCKKNEGLLQKIEKQVLNPESFFFNVNNEKNEFKTTRQIINRIVNDGKIIDNYIKNDGQVKEEILHKVDREEILLKLAERLRKNRTKIKKKKLKKKRLNLEDDKNLDLEDEQIFEIKLSKIENKYAKEFFREVYRQILSEKRLLNKRDKNDIGDVKEEKKNKIRMEKEFKKDAYKKMVIMNDNIITEKDDKIILDEQRKMFDYYGSLDGLEWLINKRHIINFGNKLAGAYKSKRKTTLKITYDN